MAEIFEWSTVTGATLIVGDLEVNLEAKTLAVRLPFGGLAWSRPSAVIVRRQGEEERIPIHDVTRIVSSAMLACTVALSIIAMAARSGRKQSRAK